LVNQDKFTAYVRLLIDNAAAAPFQMKLIRWPPAKPMAEAVGNIPLAIWPRPPRPLKRKFGRTKLGARLTAPLWLRQKVVVSDWLNCFGGPASCGWHFAWGACERRRMWPARQRDVGGMLTVADSSRELVYDLGAVMDALVSSIKQYNARAVGFESPCCHM